MRGIGGNLRATVQLKAVTKDEIGSDHVSWQDVQTLLGWLDLSGGKSSYSTYNTKIQESTHIFICDYVPLDDRIKAENARLLINGKRYDVMLLDNPMEMQAGSQWEIYLKYTGGQ